MSSNFTNGSLVMRVWQFDGGTELVAKFQYYGDAREFAAAQAKKIGADQNVFYLAVCDYENKANAYFKPKEAGQ